MEIEQIKCTVCPHTAGYNTAIDDCVRTMNDYFCKLIDKGTDTDVMFEYNKDLSRLFEGLKNDST